MTEKKILIIYSSDFCSILSDLESFASLLRQRGNKVDLVSTENVNGLVERIYSYNHLYAFYENVSQVGRLVKFIKTSYLYVEDLKKAKEDCDYLKELTKNSVGGVNLKFRAVDSFLRSYVKD